MMVAADSASSARPQSSPPESGRARLEHFDGLRALAALAVFALHAGYQIAVTQPEDRWWYPWGVRLDIGVSIFFAISGFLLYRRFLSATLAGRTVDVREYALRRVLRIVPAYWVALAVIAVWAPLKEVLSLEGALRFGLFAQVYDPDTALRGMGQAWSLDVEMAFYVALAVFALVLVRARSYRAAVLGCIGFVLVGVLWKVLALTVTDFAAPGSEPWFYTLPAHMDALGGGMLVAVAALWVADGRRLPGPVDALVQRPWLAWGAAAALFVLIGLFADGGTHSGPTISDPQAFGARTLYAVIGALLILPAAMPRDGRGGVRAFLRFPPLRWVGIISYSFYLWHYIAIAKIADWWGLPPGRGWIPWIALTLAFSLLLSVASYLLVERPFMRMRGRGRGGRGRGQRDRGRDGG